MQFDLCLSLSRLWLEYHRNIIEFNFVCVHENVGGLCLCVVCVCMNAYDCHYEQTIEIISY